MSQEPYIPNSEQMALWPDISGNEINGLGQTEKRRPSYVYWGNGPSDIAHGDLQRWFYSVYPGLPGYSEECKRQADFTAPPLR